MRRILLYALIPITLSGCVSVKSYNKKLETKHSPKELSKDIDYIHRKLERNHPDLYWYIPKEALSAKFDSLKQSITDSLNSTDFYYKLSPVIASIRQGHTRVFFPSVRLTGKEQKKLKVEKYGKTPFENLKFDIIDGRAYLSGNKSEDTTLKKGMELVSIEGQSFNGMQSRFYHTLTSDGYNQTFLPRYLGLSFSGFISNFIGMKDTLKCTFRSNDSLLIEKTLVRIPASDTVKVKGGVKRKIPSKQQRDSTIAEMKKQQLQGYDKKEKTYAKELSFYPKDSSIAILKVRNFTQGNFKKYYRQTFKKLDSLKVKTLVVDLRDNLGGSLKDAETLYSYLTDTSFYFVKKAKIISPKSMYLLPFKMVPVVIYPIVTAVYPIYFMVSSFRLSHSDGTWYYRVSSRSKIKAGKNRFKGKVFVLTNGTSFSASSIISSDLKGNKRAVFVGEETGGAYNGTVAGMMPLYTLPNSGLTMKFGLLTIVPAVEPSQEGYGIKPDYRVVPTPDNIVSGKDAALEKAVELSRARK